MMAPGNSLQVTYLSPRDAAELLSYNFAHNRRLRPAHVAFLVNEMRAGRFMETAEIHVMFRNGEPVLTNGQHTCEAIVRFGAPVRVTLRKTIVKEAGQIAMMYAFGHDTGLRRTFNDALGAYDISEEVGLTKSNLDRLAAAIKHIRSGFRASKKHVIDPPMVDLLEDIRVWAPEARLLFSAIEGRDKKMTRAIYKRGVLSVAIVTLFYQKEVALDFWRAVVDPIMLTSRDARLLARRYIRDSVGSPGTNYVAPGLLSRQLAGCWNAYLKNEPIVFVRTSETQPIVLRNTSYNGKQSDGFIANRAGIITHSLAEQDTARRPGG